MEVVGKSSAPHRKDQFQTTARYQIGIRPLDLNSGVTYQVDVEFASISAVFRYEVLQRFTTLE
jgi:hypothetical protein